MSLLRHIPFSFHCSICFEPFDHDERPPVILPCGHTFLCAQCSKRLKRCMECRTSLFLTPQSQKAKTAVPAQRHRYRNANARRYRHEPEVVKPAPPRLEDQIPLPLPKNLLLLTLMEAAEMETGAKRVKVLRQSSSQGALTADTASTGPDGMSLAFSYSEETEGDTTASVDDDDDDEERVRCGVAAISSACGTYAVSDRKGVVIVKEKPERFREKWINRSQQKAIEVKGADELEGKQEEKEVEQQEAKQEAVEKEVDDAEEKEDDEVKCEDKQCKEVNVEYGMRIQVVDMQNGVAKLARNRGFVQSSCSQIVKVDGPHDPACKIEGLLYSVASRKREMAAKLTELQNIETSLVSDLEDALLEPYPITEASEMLSASDALDSPEGGDNRSPPSCFKNAECSTSPRIQCSTAPHLPVNMSPPPSPRSPPVLPRRVRSSERHVEFSERADIFSVPQRDQIYKSFKSTLNNKNAKENEVEHQRVGCNPFFGMRNEEPYELMGNGLCDPPRLLHRLSPSANSSPRVPDSPLRSAGTQSPERLRTGPVDFRTGMSGHMGLMSARAHRELPSRGHIRMMGDHRGLARMRPVRKNERRMKEGSEQKSPNLSTTTW